MKPTVDITEAGGARWSMGKLVADALDDTAAAEFLAAFRPIAPAGTDAEVIAILLRFADLVYGGEVIQGFALKSKEEKKTMGKKDAIAIPHADTTEHNETAGGVLALVGSVQITEVNQYVDAIAVLADIKAMVEQVEAERKELTAPLVKVKKAIDDKYRPVKTKLAEAEGMIKEKLIGFRVRIAEARRQLLELGKVPAEALVVPPIQGAVFKPYWETKIDDTSQIPARYWIVDEQKVSIDLRKGEEIPGARLIEHEQVAITHKDVKR